MVLLTAKTPVGVFYGMFSSCISCFATGNGVAMKYLKHKISVGNKRDILHFGCAIQETNGINTV